MQIQGSYFEQGVTTYVSQADEEIKVVASGAGKLFALAVTNVSGATVYAYVFDNNAASGTLMLPPVKIPAGETMSVEYQGPMRFDNGCTVASSSTQATYTATTTDDLRIRAVYKS